MTTWTRRLSESELAEIVKRGHVRTVQRELPADKTPGRVAVPAKRKQPDYYTTLMVTQLQREKVPVPETEYFFCPGRKFRADMCWPERKLIVEVKGAVHRIKGRYRRDIEREQVIFQLGYRLLQVTPQQVRNGEALKLIKEALK
jgi:hypothetical protein